VSVFLGNNLRNQVRLKPSRVARPFLNHLPLILFFYFPDSLSFFCFSLLLVSSPTWLPLARGGRLYWLSGGLPYCALFQPGSGSICVSRACSTANWRMLACHRFGHTFFRLVLFHSTPCSGQDSNKWRWARMAAWLTALRPQTAATTRIKISFMGVGCWRG
jgi:hypothetical protein